MNNGVFCQRLNEERGQWLNCSGWCSRWVSAVSFYTVKQRISIISTPSEVKEELDSDKVIGGYWESSWKSESDKFLEQRTGVTVFNSSHFCILNLNAGPRFLHRQWHDVIIVWLFGGENLDECDMMRNILAQRSWGIFYFFTEGKAKHTVAQLAAVQLLCIDWSRGPLLVVQKKCEMLLLSVSERVDRISQRGEWT